MLNFDNKTFKLLGKPPKTELKTPVSQPISLLDKNYLIAKTSNAVTKDAEKYKRTPRCSGRSLKSAAEMNELRFFA